MPTEERHNAVNGRLFHQHTHELIDSMLEKNRHHEVG